MDEARRGRAVPADEPDTVGETLRRRVSERGLRAVAREVGMSPTGLGRALNGARVRSGTRGKLEAWAARQGLVVPDRVSGEALSTLLQPVADGYRAEARQYLVTALRRLYVRFEVPLPEWMGPG